MLRLDWRRIMSVCKSLVDVIWHGDIVIYFIMISFKLNSTEHFTISIHNDVVVFLNVLIRGPWFFQWFWRQSCWQRDLMLLVMWGEEKVLVCVLWGNNSYQQGFSLFLCKQNGLLVWDRISVFCIQLRHDHFEWEVWEYIILCCLKRWPTQGSKHIHGNFFCWREWRDKSLMNQFKWNEHRLWKLHCWEGVWMWWDQQFVCKFLLANKLYFLWSWIVHGKDLLFVVENVYILKGVLFSCSLVTDMYE